MAELPLAMWILFVVLTIPMIDLATTSLRATFLVAATRDAAHWASRAETFQVPLGTNPSAQTAAPAQVANTVNSFTGVKVTNVTTNLISTNITTGKVTRQSTPLAQPADTNTNTYAIEVIVTAKVDPLIKFNTGLFNNMPGLSAPTTVTCTAQEFAEYPQGLNQ